MGHIEFIGPPGAGKSAIHSRLIANDSLYGGIDEDGFQRKFLQDENKTYRLIYRLSPNKLRQFILSKLLAYKIRYNSFEKFVDHHPEFLNVLYDVKEMVKTESDVAFHITKQVAEEYQTNITTQRDNEILVMDEGFGMRAVSILWRTDQKSFPIKKYIDVVPTPSVLVYVNAPVEVCVERQKKRERITIQKKFTNNDLYKAQTRYREICEEVTQQFQKQTKIIRVNNISSVENPAEKVKQKIVQLMRNNE